MVRLLSGVDGLVLGQSLTRPCSSGSKEPPLAYVLPLRVVQEQIHPDGNRISGGWCFIGLHPTNRSDLRQELADQGHLGSRMSLQSTVPLSLSLQTTLDVAGSNNSKRFVDDGSDIVCEEMVLQIKKSANGRGQRISYRPIRADDPKRPTRFEEFRPGLPLRGSRPKSPRRRLVRECIERCGTFSWRFPGEVSFIHGAIHRQYLIDLGSKGVLIDV